MPNTYGVFGRTIESSFTVEEYLELVNGVIGALVRPNKDGDMQSYGLECVSLLLDVGISAVEEIEKERDKQSRELQTEKASS